MIAATAIIKGTGISFGIKVESSEGATGYYDSNIDNKARKTAELISSEDYDFGFMHIKAVDDAGHDKRLDMKISQLEKIDLSLGILVDELAKKSNHLR